MKKNLRSKFDNLPKEDIKEKRKEILKKDSISDCYSKGHAFI